MIDLYELRQLTAFADLGTLSKVAEEFHISTPSVTRSMQHLEDAFGVPLFIRGKNRIELNDTGNTAVEYARKLLAEAEQAVAQVRAFDQRQRTILVKSCAPAPLWKLLKALNAAQPNPHKSKFSKIMSPKRTQDFRTLLKRWTSCISYDIILNRYFQTYFYNMNPTNVS